MVAPINDNPYMDCRDVFLQLRLQEMTLYEFNLLKTHLEKYDAIFTKGEFIHVLYKNNKKFALYAINKFFVEIEYDSKNNRIIGYKSFKSGHLLDKHAEDIELS